MLTDFNGADHVYIACGYTDLRRGIRTRLSFCMNTSQGEEQSIRVSFSQDTQGISTQTAMPDTMI